MKGGTNGSNGGKKVNSPAHLFTITSNWIGSNLTLIHLQSRTKAETGVTGTRSVTKLNISMCTSPNKQRNCTKPKWKGLLFKLNDQLTTWCGAFFVKFIIIEKNDKTFFYGTQRAPPWEKKKLIIIIFPYLVQPSLIFTTISSRPNFILSFTKGAKVIYKGQ